MIYFLTGKFNLSELIDEGFKMHSVMNEKGLMLGDIGVEIESLHELERFRNFIGKPIMLIESFLQILE